MTTLKGTGRKQSLQEKPPRGPGSRQLEPSGTVQTQPETSVLRSFIQDDWVRTRSAYFPVLFLAAAQFWKYVALLHIPLSSTVNSGDLGSVSLTSC